MSEPTIVSLSGVRLIMIHPGRFRMGSPENEPGREDDEVCHEVTIGKRFWMGEHPITQGQYESVMHRNPSHFYRGGKQLPVESVNFLDAMAFCQNLTLLDRKRGIISSLQHYRLPTEAEWEYACRAGSCGPVYTGPIRILGDNNCPELETIAWYGGNSAADYHGAHSTGLEVKRRGPFVFWSKWRDKSHDHSRAGPQPVGKLRPNAWGLYDMLGNIKEWCSDWDAPYGSDPVENPLGPPAGSLKISRGGAWNCVARMCRCAYRGCERPDGRHADLGFRIVIN